MIWVTVVRTKDNQIRSFQVSGHAEYAESGQDIVCSAVSALTITTINALSKPTEAYQTPNAVDVMTGSQTARDKLGSRKGKSPDRQLRSQNTC